MPKTIVRSDNPYTPPQVDVPSPPLEGDYVGIPFPISVFDLFVRDARRTYSNVTSRDKLPAETADIVNGLGKEFSEKEVRVKPISDDGVEHYLIFGSRYGDDTVVQISIERDPNGTAKKITSTTSSNRKMSMFWHVNQSSTTTTTILDPVEIEALPVIQADNYDRPYSISSAKQLERLMYGDEQVPRQAIFPPEGSTDTNLAGNIKALAGARLVETRVNLKPRRDKDFTPSQDQAFILVDVEFHQPVGHSPWVGVIPKNGHSSLRYSPNGTALMETNYVPGEGGIRCRAGKILDWKF